MKVFDSKLNKVVDSTAYQAIEKLMKMKAKGDVWGVWELAFELFEKKNKEKFESLIVGTKEDRENQKTEFGTSGDKNSKLRRTVNFPEEVMYIFRRVYNPEEVPMDKKFMRTLWKRYPRLRVSERL